MDRQRPTPTWPFLSILVCLFVLSLGAPRGWERVARPKPVGNLLASQPRARVVRVADRPEVLTPAEPPVLANVPKPGNAAPQAGIAPQPEVTSHPAMTAITRLPAVDVPAPKVAGPMLDPALVASRVSRRPFGRSAAAAAAELPAVCLPPELSRDPLAQPHHATARPAVARREPPQSLALQRMLDRLVHDPQLGVWALRVSSLVHELNGGMTDADERAVAICELQMELGEADCLADQLNDAAAASQLRRVRHALGRRVAIWDALARIDAPAAQVAARRDPHRLSLALAEVEAQTAGSDMGQGWRDYLLVDSLRQLAEHEGDDEAAQREVAAQVLKRLHRAGLNTQQREFIGAGSLASLAAELRPWAAQPVSQDELLAQIERYESSGLTSDAAQLVRLAETLGLTDDPAAEELSEYFESNYRNANFRVAISRELIERLVPAQPVMEAQIRDTILGLPVRGRSTVWSQMRVELTPDESRLRLALIASGLISANTGTTKGPATVYNNSKSLYTVEQQISVGAKGLKIEPPQASVNTSVRLRGIDTEFDGIPFLGMVVQNVARNKQEESSFAARRESESKIAQQAASRIDREAGERMREAAERFDREVCHPLVGLGLDPRFIQLKTTDERLVARIRLAGEDQIGAHTPRPEAPSDSLASVQIHESAANNLIERLGLDGQQMSIADAYHQIRAKLERPAKKAPAEMRRDVMIRFAPRDALHVRCQDGLLQLAISISELSAEGHSFRNFTVLVDYRPSFSGSRPELVREGVIRLTGPRLSTKSQVALRGIFSKVFLRDRSLPLVPQKISDDPRLQGLTLTQFVVVDGWIGLAMGPQRALPQAAVVRR